MIYSQSTSVSFTKSLTFQKQFKKNKNKMVKNKINYTDQHTFSGIQNFLDIFERNLENIKKKKMKIQYYASSTIGYLIIFTDYTELNNKNIEREIHYILTKIGRLVMKLFKDDSCFYDVFIPIQFNIRKSFVQGTYNNKVKMSLEPINHLFSSKYPIFFYDEEMDNNKFDKGMRLFIPGLKSIK